MPDPARVATETDMDVLASCARGVLTSSANNEKESWLFRTMGTVTNRQRGIPIV